ncbi:hypothetical protein GOODEAATRI_006137, partial [Goodea atripinnis]
VRQSSQTGISKQALELERCEEILKKLMKFRYSWPFRDPVSPDEAEDYLDIISEPMDFQTMLGKFSQGSYRHAQDFLEDMKLVFSNAEEYNQQGSTVLSCMVKTEQTFTELIQKLLPGISYLRRRSRKRISQAPPSSEEEEEEEEEEDDEEDCEEQVEEPKKKMQNGKSNQKTTRKGRAQKDESESEEDSEEEENSSRRRSKRTSATSGRKDYRELDSDGEQDTRRTRHRRERGDASSDEERPSHQQRHSKRLKRS